MTLSQMTFAAPMQNVQNFFVRREKCCLNKKKKKRMRQEKVCFVKFLSSFFFFFFVDYFKRLSVVVFNISETIFKVQFFFFFFCLALVNLNDVCLEGHPTGSIVTYIWCYRKTFISERFYSSINESLLLLIDYGNKRKCFQNKSSKNLEKYSWNENVIDWLNGKLAKLLGKGKKSYCWLFSFETPWNWISNTTLEP